MGDTMMDKVDAYFKMSERKTNFSQEFRGGVATFLAMVYIVVVNADILSSSGGPCPDDRKVIYKDVEMTCEAGKFNFFFDPTGCYMECVADTKKSLITVTALCASIATLAMGVFANVPFALAPGMGLNAYFTYTVVGFMGSNSKNIDWKTAITAVFIEGLFFFVLSVTGARGFISRAIPKSIKLATTGGIGMFLAHLGLQTAEGIGMVVGDVATGITLGGCKPEYRHNLWMCSHGNITSAYRGDPAAFAGLDDNGVPNPVIYDPPPPNFCVGSSTYTCDIDPGFAPGWQGGGIMESPTTWLGIFGVIIITILLIKKQTASFAIITGVVFVSVLSWFKNSEVSFFEADILPTHGGMDAKTRWDYFSKVVKVEDISITSGKLDFGRFDQGDVWVAIIFFLFNDMLDTMSTLIAMANFAGLADEQGQFPGQEAAFVIDSIGTSLGALLGTSPVTTYIESAAGIEAGGRTGITSVVTAFFFFLCIFFAPILSSVPPWATGPVLIVVGAMMMKGVTKIAWDNYGEAVPAFACIIIMPLTYSLSWGIAAGIFTYAMVNVPSYLLDLFVFKTETWPSVYWTELFPAKTEEEAVKEPAGALTA